MLSTESERELDIHVNSYRLLLWRTDTDQFYEEQWLKGRIYELQRVQLACSGLKISIPNIRRLIEAFDSEHASRKRCNTTVVDRGM